MTGDRPISTTDMQVTSIRLEQTLKEHLKVLAGQQGYQALIREVLWDYVNQHHPDGSPRLQPEQIRATVAATSQQLESCALTGTLILPQTPMLLGLTVQGQWVALAPEYGSAESHPIPKTALTPSVI